MIKVQPQGQIYLCKTPLENDYKNQLTFASKSAQSSYFLNTVVKSFDNNTYIHKDGGVKINCNAEEIRTCNYMFYQNTGFDNRIYYCFITSIEYISENSTLVKFETDCFQTWYFDLEYKPCFVEREHVSNDTVGLHTVPENLETGEYVKNSLTGTKSINKQETYWYAVGLSEIVGTLSANPASLINNVPQGLYYVFTDSASILHDIVEIYDAEGKANAIYTMFIFPKALLLRTQGSSSEWEYQSATWEYSKAGQSISILTNLYVPTANSVTGALVSGYQINLPTTVGMTYVPKNNKLFTFPYCYFNVSNNSGTVVTYHYEDFNGKPTFNVDGAFSVGCDTKLYPTNYKNMDIFSGDIVDNPYDYGVTGGKYPTLSWNSDSFTNWITQNGVNMNANVVTSFTSGAISGGLYGGLAGAVVGSTTSGLMAVINNVARTTQASHLPAQAHGNTNVGDINFSKHKTSFTVFEMSIKPEYARIIDDFFTMFGYKVNVVKTPSITGRTYWNYVKTIDCNIEGDVPQEDLQVIRNIFNQGCTFWHDPSNMYNYNLTNSIVS